MADITAAWTLSPRPWSSARRPANSTLCGEMSIAQTSAPAAAKNTDQMPVPQPTSSTFLPERSPNRLIMQSTRGPVMTIAVARSASDISLVCSSQNTASRSSTPWGGWAPSVLSNFFFHSMAKSDRYDAAEYSVSLYNHRETICAYRPFQTFCNTIFAGQSISDATQTPAPATLFDICVRHAMLDGRS